MNRCLNKKLHGLIEKLDSLIEKLDSLIEKLDSLIEKLDSLIEKLDSLIEKLDDLNDKNLKGLNKKGLDSDDSFQGLKDILHGLNEKTLWFRE